MRRKPEGMTKPPDQPRRPPIPVVAPQASAICPGHLGFKGVSRKDGVLSFIPIIGWVTTTILTPTGPDWRFNPIFAHPAHHWPVHQWGVPNWLVVVPKSWSKRRTGRWIDQREKEMAEQKAKGQQTPNDFSFPQGGQAKA